MTFGIFVQLSSLSNFKIFSSPQKETPYSLAVALYSSLPQSLVTTNLLPMSMVLPIMKFHINEIT